MLLVAGVGVMAFGVGVGGYAIVEGGDGGTTASAATPSTAAASTSTLASTTTAPTTTTIAPTTTTTVPPIVQPAPAALPAPPNGALRSGNRGPEVQAYEERLKALHFDPGAVDGVFDSRTTYAVQAVDKIIGAPRDGIITPAVQAALQGWQYQAGVPNGEANRTEINLDQQVLTVYTAGQVTLITTTSTGNGSHFCGGDDGCQYAITPVGKFKFEWNYRGWRTGPLGKLYNPYYFNGGIAVHGFNSVPTKAASHGCARIPMHISEYFATLVHKGEPVYVFGTEAPKGGFKGGSSGSGTPATTAPPATAPPVTPPPDTTPSATTTPATAPPDTTPPDTVAPVTTPPVTEPPVTVPEPTVPPDTTPPEPPTSSP